MPLLLYNKKGDICHAGYSWMRSMHLQPSSEKKCDAVWDVIKKLNVIICKQTVFTDKNFTNCSWARVMTSFTKRWTPSRPCLWMTELYDIVTGKTHFSVECAEQVLLEHPEKALLASDSEWVYIYRNQWCWWDKTLHEISKYHTCLKLRL